MLMGYLVRFALTIVVAVLFAGCGGPGQVGTGAATSKSWILPGSSGGDLIYVAADGTSYVLSYPKGKPMGTIQAGALDACSDSAGDVFLTVDDSVLEYAHGATTPSATLTLSGTTVGCAVDPKTGNLAVTFFGGGSNDVAIFPNGSGTPSLYNAGGAFYCGYDNDGNLFVDTQEDSGIRLSELPYGSSDFYALTISPGIGRNPGTLQWDGQYLAMEAGIGTNHPRHLLAVYQLSVNGSTATVVNTVHFAGVRFSSFLSWIHAGKILIPYSGSKKDPYSYIGIWAYPKGGKPLKRIRGPSAVFNAVTLSIGY
jgi:hypothetical protein